MIHHFAGRATVIGFFLTAAALAAPPHVTKAVPDNGATDVDPNTTELRVTFDQPMDQGGFSFVGGGDTFPGSGQRAHWIDPQTCVFPITLKPDHDYWISINNQTFQNFRNKQREPATPYPISFHTASTAPPLTPQSNDAAIAKLRDAINNDYAYISVHKVDWDQAFVQRVLEPNAQRPAFTGKVALLIGPENMSSCESFIEMMKTNPNCTTIGAKTEGSSGNPKPHDLGNGVTVMLPSWRDYCLDGTCLEGVGLTPDIAIAGGAEGGADPVLDRALTLLRPAN